MKILIINENRHNSIGGIETYTNNLINLFTSLNHEVHEFAFNINPEKINQFPLNNKAKHLNVVEKTNKPLSLFKKRHIIKENKKEILKIWKNYDLIINQTSNIKWIKEIYNSPKWLYIQHFNPDFYKQKYVAGKLLRPIIYYGMNLVGIKNPFNKFQNFVFFSNEDKRQLNKKLKRSWVIPLAALSREELNKFKNNSIKSREKNVIFIGRLDQKQKNINKLIKLSKKIDIDFYGHGKSRIVNKLNDKYKGPADKKDVLNLISKYKFSILLSKYEGFPFSVIESLSTSTPIIISDFCPSSIWLSDKKGILIQKRTRQKQIVNFINMMHEQYESLQKNCYEFVKTNLTIEKFNEKWINVLNEFKQT